MDIASNILKAQLRATLERYKESGGIDKDTLLVIGFICFAKILIIDIIFGRSGQLICHFIGFAYPAYRTTKVIESNRNGGDDIDKIQWLMYWVVFASFHLVEFFSDTILGWMPMYWIGKSIFLLACMSPLNLCSVLYHMTILPLFKKSEAFIDNFAADCRSYALTQCQKSLSLDTKYGRLELEALSDSVETYPNIQTNKSSMNKYDKILGTDTSSRFEELETLSCPISSNASNKQPTLYTPSLSTTGTSHNLPEMKTVRTVSISHDVSGIPDNIAPRQSPKKKKAPPPPNRKLTIDEEEKIEKYLDDHF